MISPAASANACSASGYPALFTSAVKWLCCSRKPLNAPSRRKRNPFRGEPDQENIVRTKGRRHCRCAWCSLCPLRLCALRVEFLLPSRNRGAHLCACKSCRRNPLGIISFAYSRGLTLIDSHPYIKNLRWGYCIPPHLASERLLSRTHVERTVAIFGLELS